MSTPLHRPDDIIFDELRNDFGLFMSHSLDADLVEIGVPPDIEGNSHNQDQAGGHNHFEEKRGTLKYRRHPDLFLEDSR